MAFVSLRQLLDHAAEYDYGFPAFNVNNLEQIQSVMEAAHETDSPVIIQASRGARKYAGDVFLSYLLKAASKSYPHIPICYHQDHGNSLETCASAIRNDFTSVMMDGSLKADGKTPSDYVYNQEITQKVSNLAHPLGVSVEGELGCLGSLETGKGDKEDGHGFEGSLSKEQLLTNPTQAVNFVKHTQVDALAVAIGTSHGAYKFSRKPDGKILAMQVIKEINERIPTLHMVMHGSSSVPQELQDIINQYGGKIPQTFGVPIEEIQEGIKNGVRKINVDTDCRMAIAGQIRKVLVKSQGEFDPRKIMAPGRDKMKEVCKIRYDAFGTSGNASKIKPISLLDMAVRYQKGELNHSFK